MINDDPIDRFTLAHGVGGMVLERMGATLPVTVFVAIGWELIERPLKRHYPSWFPHPSQDSTVNSLLDAAAVVAGYLLVERR